jgi:hypothetical protein
MLEEEDNQLGTIEFLLCWSFQLQNLGNQWLDFCLIAVLAAQLGTPRGRYDEHSGKFSPIMNPRFNRPVGDRNHF